MVACHGGLSRSATTVLCYLILHERMSAYDAITQLRQIRNISPSKQQLLYIARLHNKEFGFQDVDEDDDDNPVSFIRQLLTQRPELVTK